MRVSGNTTRKDTVSGINATELAKDARREQIGIAGLTLPSVLLVSIILLLPFTWLSYLSLVEDGQLTFVHYERLTTGIYFRVFLTTFELSLIVTVVCVALGYPLAFTIAQLPGRAATICLMFVIFPFWTSLLVRTYAWLILLQRNGIVNSFLQDIGVIETPLKLVHNFNGTIIGMVHVLLPFFILPLYASMKQIDRDYLKAAASLGATPSRVFWQVFVPLSLPGLIAGTVLIFVLSLGFYVTPTLLGGGKVLVWAIMIANNVSQYANWGAASALGVVLVVVTLGLLYGFNKVLQLKKPAESTL